MDMAFNTVCTLDNHTILECMYEHFIEEEVSHSMDKFVPRMHQYVLLLCIPFPMECGHEVTEVVRELKYL
jgi:hypothetical protein